MLNFMYSMKSNHLIIMAGGVGSRFWPMSTPERPKQFIDVLGMGKSLLQMTIERFEGVIPKDNVWIVTSRNYKDIIREQVPEIEADHVLLEPCMRNTAPCIAYVAYKIRERYPNANLVFSPSDHIVVKTEHFRTIIRKVLDYTAVHDAVVTLGMYPTRPETGYGYIKAIPGDGDVRKVESFKEKPDLKTAEKYITNGNYYWNAGIFVWNVNTVISEIRSHVPELADRFDSIISSFYTCEEQSVIDREFPFCPNISIDYAVMEKSTKTYVCPAEFGWSDLGTWGSLYTLINKDINSNAIIGDGVKMIDCKDCIVRVPDERKVILQNLDGYIVVENGGCLLVCRKQDEQKIKEWNK